ncbi:MAG: GtrA family protein [Chitinophagales bacterium]
MGNGNPVINLAGRNKNEMTSFIKSQIASILGSTADYLTTIALVSFFDCFYLLANFAGNCVGGTAQFFLCRKWAFLAAERQINAQIIKFILVFAGNLLLSAAGVLILTKFVGLNYIISKTICSVLLGISYNYLLQKKFVFSQG